MTGSDFIVRNQTVVVTGVAGFIGSTLAEKLLEEGYTVKGIDNFDPYYSQDIKKQNIRDIIQKGEETGSNFELVKGSINNVSDLAKLPERPYKLFHLAAKPGTRSSIGNLSKYEKTNVKGTSKVLDYFDPVKKMVHMSSSSIYGEKKVNQLPVKEEDSKNPQNPYAQTKLEAERLVKQKRNLGDDTVILRPFTVFGPRQRPDEMFTSFISDIVDGEKINVYGDGSQSRDFTFVDDIVKGVLMASEKGSGVYNLGKGKRNTVQEVINLIDGKMTKDVKAIYESERRGDVTHTHADIKKAKKDFGFDPLMDIDKPVEETINWVKNMKEGKLL